MEPDRNSGQPGVTTDRRSTTDGYRIAVIGRCAARGCRRPATVHLVALTPAGRRIQGSVCAHCDRASQVAAFLLDLFSAA